MNSFILYSFKISVITCTYFMPFHVCYTSFKLRINKYIHTHVLLYIYLKALILDFLINILLPYCRFSRIEIYHFVSVSRICINGSYVRAFLRDTCV
jgi:hypothetical protein